MARDTLAEASSLTQCANRLSNLAPQLNTAGAATQFRN
jgi:hypothetical protein